MSTEAHSTKQIALLASERYSWEQQWTGILDLRPVHIKLDRLRSVAGKGGSQPKFIAFPPNREAIQMTPEHIHQFLDLFDIRSPDSVLNLERFRSRSNALYQLENFRLVVVPSVPELSDRVDELIKSAEYLLEDVQVRSAPSLAMTATVSDLFGTARSENIEESSILGAESSRDNSAINMHPARRQSAEVQKYNVDLSLLDSSTATAGSSVASDLAQHGGDCDCDGCLFSAFVVDS